MNDQTLRDILRRLNALERTSARVRVGEVTDVNPLDVALGGSDTSYEDVKAIGPVANGDQVATLVWGNDMLILGALAGGIRYGATTVTYTASLNSATATVTHGVGSTPTAVLTTISGFGLACAVGNVGATTFQVQGSAPQGATSGTFTVYWVAIA